MSESNLIPSLNTLPSAEYIPSGYFETERADSAPQEVRQYVNEALAAADNVNHTPEYQEAPAAPVKAEAQLTPEAMQVDYVRKASKNLALVRQRHAESAQSDSAQAA